MRINAFKQVKSAASGAGGSANNAVVPDNSSLISSIKSYLHYDSHGFMLYCILTIKEKSHAS